MGGSKREREGKPSIGASNRWVSVDPGNPSFKWVSFGLEGTPASLSGSNISSSNTNSNSGVSPTIGDASTVNLTDGNTQNGSRANATARNTPVFNNANTPSFRVSTNSIKSEPTNDNNVNINNGSANNPNFSINPPLKHANSSSTSLINAPMNKSNSNFTSANVSPRSVPSSNPISSLLNTTNVGGANPNGSGGDGAGVSTTDTNLSSISVPGETRRFRFMSDNSLPPLPLRPAGLGSMPGRISHTAIGTSTSGYPISGDTTPRLSFSEDSTHLTRATTASIPSSSATVANTTIPGIHHNGSMSAPLPFNTMPAIGSISQLPRTVNELAATKQELQQQKHTAAAAAAAASSSTHLAVEKHDGPALRCLWLPLDPGKPIGPQNPVVQWIPADPSNAWRTDTQMRL